jgi:replicative DNA helicase
MIALIMAQAGLGKSVFLSNLAVSFLKQNLSVVVISLEMSQDVYAQRFDAHISSKNINRLAENE